MHFTTTMVLIKKMRLDFLSLSTSLCGHNFIIERNQSGLLCRAFYRIMLVNFCHIIS